MYTALKLYKVSKNNIDLYDPKDITPEAFQHMNDVNSSLYIAIEDTVEKARYSLFYSKLITDDAVVSCATWESLMGALTDRIIKGYSTDIPCFSPGQDHPDNHVKVWDVMSTTNTFDIHYADASTGRIGKFAFRWQQKDLVISIQDGAEKYPNLKYCIPVVNGFICRPIYRDDYPNTLFALDGAHLCWQTFHGHTTPEIQLLDFSSIGEIKICNITTSPKKDTDFHLTFHDRISHFNLFSDWKLQNSVYPLPEYTPIIVLAGTAILPDQYRKANTDTVIFNPSHFPLNAALAKRQVLIDLPMDSAVGLHYQTSDLETYFRSELTTPLYVSQENFIILVKTPFIYVRRMTLDTWSNGILINSLEQPSILLHNVTGTLSDYYNAQFSFYNELTTQYSTELKRTDSLFSDKQVAFEQPRCDHIDPIELRKSSHTLLYLMN